MTQFSKGQLEALWATANPGNGDPHLMAAIALAESSGNSTEVNSIGACGLWQIHPFESGCLNPVTNARQAGRKLSSQGLGAWETYTNGAYKQFYTGVATPTREDAGILKDFMGPEGEAEEKLFEKVPGLSQLLEGANAEAGGKDPFSLFGNLTGDFKKLFEGKFWLRIGKVLVGLFLLLTGVLGMGNISVPNVIPLPV